MIKQNGRSSGSEMVRLDLEQFSEDAPQRLRSLKGRLGRNSFEFEKAKGVPIPKLDRTGKPTGKIRPIVLAPVESRIVQRAVLNVLVDQESLQPYIATPFSFGGIRSARKRGEQTRDEQVSAVPAAIKAVLNEIDQGRCFIASADIRAFFTRVSKEHVLGVIGAAIGDDPEFLAFVRKAITVELGNIAVLKEWAADFPTADIGVAQGNSLSPLLGNIALADFDRVMNEGDCRCIRYIDDFIIMAPTSKAANARLAKAIKLLSGLGMELSSEKSSKGASSVDKGFEFLGVYIRPGLIRPGEKAQARFLSSIADAFAQSKKAMIGLRSGVALEPDRSLVTTLKRVGGMVDGWGKHYWFCNDGQVFAGLDQRINAEVRAFLGAYRAVRDAVPASVQMPLLGLSELARMKREPFKYPTKGKPADP